MGLDIVCCCRDHDCSTSYFGFFEFKKDIRESLLKYFEENYIKNLNIESEELKGVDNNIYDVKNEINEYIDEFCEREEDWKCLKVLLIGRMKEKDHLLSLLPQPIFNYIMKFVRVDFEDHKVCVKEMEELKSNYKKRIENNFRVLYSNLCNNKTEIHQFIILEKLNLDGYYYILNHSDCEGYISPKGAKKILELMTRIWNYMPEDNFKKEKKLKNLFMYKSLKCCIENNKILKFC